MAESITHPLRLSLLTAQTVAVGLMWYWKLSMIQVGLDYSPTVLAAIHHRQPGLAIPILLTIGTAFGWFACVRHAFRHEDDPL